MAKKNLTKQGIALVLGIALGGFGWMTIKNFAELFVDFTTNQQLMIGIIGFVFIGWLVKNYGIRVRSPLRK